MTGRPRRTFKVLAILLSVGGAGGVLLGADLYLHHRAERSAGLNRWGYRGPVVGAKRPGETRIVMLGGSTVFGYGVFWDQAIPAVLERELRQADPTHPVSVINLGFNNEGAFALVPTLRDFAYLDPDVAIFYAGYNEGFGDLGPNTAVYRHESPVFRAFGYFPILPLVLREKAVALRTGGQLVASDNATAQRTAKPVFSPNLAERTSAGALEAMTKISETMSAPLNWIARRPPEPGAPPSAGCAYPWVSYCASLFQAISYARGEGLDVVVAWPPLMTGDNRKRHEEQQAAAAAMVAQKFSSDSRVRSVDLSHAVDLADRHLSFDGMHLDQDGNAVIAQALAAPLRTVLVAR